LDEDINKYLYGMKTLQIIPTADAIKPDGLHGKTAVVIDVLRATSVIVTALQNGARQIRPAAEVEEARRLSVYFAHADPSFRSS
jgi:2-phosphosulfolactate phosphatase